MHTCMGSSDAKQQACKTVPAWRVQTIESMQFSRLERITACNHTAITHSMLTHWIVLLHLMVLDSHISKWHIGWICPMSLHTKALNEFWPHLFILGNWVDAFGPHLFILRHLMNLDHNSPYWGIEWIWSTTLHTAQGIWWIFPQLLVLRHWVNLDHSSSYYCIGCIWKTTCHTKALGVFGKQLVILRHLVYLDHSAWGIGSWIWPQLFILRRWMDLVHITSYYGIVCIWTTSLHTEAFDDFGP